MRTSGKHPGPPHQCRYPPGQSAWLRCSGPSPLVSQWHCHSAQQIQAAFHGGMTCQRMQSGRPLTPHCCGLPTHPHTHLPTPLAPYAQQFQLPQSHKLVAFSYRIRPQQHLPALRKDPQTTTSASPFTRGPLTSNSSCAAGKWASPAVDVSLLPVTSSRRRDGRGPRPSKELTSLPVQGRHVRNEPWCPDGTGLKHKLGHSWH